MAVAFEIAPFAATEEIWQKALASLGTANKDETKSIRRIGTNHVQIVESEQINNLISSTDFLPRKVIAEFISKNKENTIWIKK